MAVRGSTPVAPLARVACCSPHRGGTLSSSHAAATITRERWRGGGEIVTTGSAHRGWRVS